MRLLVITDLEGVAEVDSFFETRTGREERKSPAMDRLASEVNACIEGIRSRASDARIDVWDGHGSGGLRGSDLEGGRYLGGGRPYFHLAGEHREIGEDENGGRNGNGEGGQEGEEDYDGVLFVGQHAMAGTPDAPLCHTYSSLAVDYYKLNGVFVGEFACRALIAGLQGVPTVFLAGDDKATLEARQFVPGIETVATKYGTGRESARHRDPEAVEEAIRQGAASTIDRLDEIAPYDRLEPPYTLEIRYYEPANVSKLDRIGGLLRRYVPPLAEALPFATGVTRIDSRTIRIEAEELLDPESGLYVRL